MLLKSPFNGPIFDQMFQEAVESVTAHILTAYPNPTEQQKTYLNQSVPAVIGNLLNDIAFNGIPGYVFGGENSLLVARVSQEAGTDTTLAETIISEVYTEDSTGEIPHWFENPAAVIAMAKSSKATFLALQPSFIQRVAGTIFAPFGITGGQAILYIQILIGLVALVAVAYIVRTVKR